MESYISQNLKFLRKKKGLTQLEMAGVLFVTPQAVSKWERGESLPDITLIPQLAQLFSVSISTLWEASIEEPVKNQPQEWTELTNFSVSDEGVREKLVELRAISDAKDIVIRLDFFLVLNSTQKSWFLSGLLAMPGSDYLVEEFYVYLSSEQKEQVVIDLLEEERYLALELLIPMMAKGVRMRVLEISLKKQAFDFLEELLPFLTIDQKQIIVNYAHQELLEVSLFDNYLTFFSEKQRQQLMSLEEE